MITPEIKQRILDFLAGFEDCEHNGGLATALIEDINRGHEVILPFDGFYNSTSDSLIDREINELFDPEGNGVAEIPDDFYLKADFSDIRVGYCKLYVEAYQEYLEEDYDLKLDLKFKDLDSPKAYNFTTDRLVVEISDEDLRKLFTCVISNWKDEFENACKERFTSRSGFISSYDPNWETWGDVLEWDHNQIGTLFEALETPDIHELMEDAQCSGHLSSLVWNKLNDEAKALVPE